MCLKQTKKPPEITKEKLLSSFLSNVNFRHFCQRLSKSVRDANRPNYVIQIIKNKNFLKKKETRRWLEWWESKKI